MARAALLALASLGVLASTSCGDSRCEATWLELKNRPPVSVTPTDLVGYFTFQPVQCSSLVVIGKPGLDPSFPGNYPVAVAGEAPPGCPQGELRVTHASTTKPDSNPSIICPLPTDGIEFRVVEAVGSTVGNSVPADYRRRFVGRIPASKTECGDTPVIEFEYEVRAENMKFVAFCE